MKLLEIFVLSLVSVWSVVSCEDVGRLKKELSDVVLTTGLGKIRGTYLTSNSGRNFYAFRGIRYAQPPVGDLRFKNPIPIEQWNGIYDATEDGPMCPQPAANSSDVSEDCLRINVYTHELPSESNPNVRRPVVVYLHPGGFYAVSGQSKNFAGPQYLMNRQIVLVTLNYRLGSLGFMSTGTADAPGNAGLKDQVMAFKWIKLHIARFGGDPNSVTLLGYSAGAVSITLHMISPMSRGLFHKAIVMSGSGVSQWEVPSSQVHLAKKQARLLNCPDSNISLMIDCLKKKHYLEYANTLPSMFEFGKGNPVLLWKPVIEEDFGQERFLTEDPVKVYQSGRFMRIPLIAGITKDEFVGPAVDVLNNKTLREEMDNNFEEIAPICFLYERNTPRSRNISAQLRSTFLGDGPLSINKSLEGLSHLFADGLISFGMHRFVHLAARLTKVYYYRFSFQGRYSHLYYPDDKPYGVVHHDDLIYLLPGPQMFTEEDPEYKTMERLTRMIATFAYRGASHEKLNSSNSVAMSIGKMKFALIFLACVIYVVAATGSDQDVIVTTNLGKIRGSILQSRLGTEFYAFRGIRYANPPVGDLRFRAPEPVKNWTDIFDATEDGPICPQGYENASSIAEMSEDCLRLNVYTRELPSLSNRGIKKPVLVYFHPGGYYFASGQSKTFAGPQLLLDREIVLVTLNYRLSSLGFLAAGTQDAPGNAGLKDQVQALRWVKGHISHFGGDPDSVTLVGYSAGAMSVTLHMVSPMSRDLFHKAIVMSGSAIAQWKIPENQIEIAKKQAKLVNCAQDNVSEMVKCLKNKPTKDYIDTVWELFEFSGNPIILWSPVVEPDFGQERFLTEDPVKSFQDGNFMKIPVIAGFTKDEFVGPAIGVLRNNNLREEMDTNWEKIAPICFLYERDTERSKNISQELRQVFLGNQSLDISRSVEGLGYLFSDGVIGFGMHRFVRLAARHTKVFNYRFTYQGRYSHLYYPKDKPYGVVHHDDLLYILAIPARAPLFTERYPEHVTVERLTRMWTQFAKTGDPNKSGDEYIGGVRWRPFSFRKESYLDIGNELVMKEGLYTERFAVWKKLFPLNWVPKRNRGFTQNESAEEDYPLDPDHIDHDEE